MLKDPESFYSVENQERSKKRMWAESGGGGETGLWHGRCLAGLVR